ncbi:helix-turn-helix domain-containing protein [Methylobacterium sp. J-067]|uniref:helix-turn-helix domain-containing protein n=1 Tax=Methylobacterium sp. J-067 TaxID=2836648 RepID=UPI001FBBEAD4|nr:helix-turn-helix transcriptional regulator [Methylobacterium sp. J-067]MCJ2023127.1 helix-turn-helix transcriptional regulator [Methylobacterium sp. J-067]
MEQAREALIANLQLHARAARLKMALSTFDVGRLTKISAAAVDNIEHGDKGGQLSLDELIELARFLGLTTAGLPRAKPVALPPQPNG